MRRISYCKNYKCKFSDYNCIKQKLLSRLEAFNELFSIFVEVKLNLLIMKKIYCVFVSLLLLTACTSYEQKVEEVRKELIDKILPLDQDPRNAIIKLWQEAPEDTIRQKELVAEILHNDSVNLARVIEILENYELDFGEENEIIWAVIQHGGIEVQQKYIQKFEKAANLGKIKGELVAMMQDRIRCSLGLPQIYGTQGNMDSNGNFVPAAIEDSANVDVRRAELGMEPLQDYINKISNRQ